MFYFSLKTRGSYDTINGQQRDKTADTRARERLGDKDSHLRAGRVASTGSHRRQMNDPFQFRAPHCTRHRESRFAYGWMTDDEDGSIDVQETFQDDMQMV